MSSLDALGHKTQPVISNKSNKNKSITAKDFIKLIKSVKKKPK